MREAISPDLAIFLIILIGLAIIWLANPAEKDRR